MLIKDLKNIKKSCVSFFYYYLNNMTIFTYLYKMYDTLTVIVRLTNWISLKMKILQYDCFSGISGDMNLGAMIDLGVDKDFLISQLKKLGVDGWEITVEKDQRHGITGTKVTVYDCHEHHHYHEHEEEEQHHHEHKHQHFIGLDDNHAHTHEHLHESEHHHSHVHRHLSDIRKIINESGLSDKEKELSLKMFKKVAEAEAKVHNADIEEVHFHEVGTIDSIIDIVGAAICFNALEVDAVHVSPVELGGGFVRCAHGTLPVPAPATTEIIKDIPVRRDGVNFEATTPTGATIVATLGNSFGTPPKMIIEKTGYGIGQKQNPEKPNILRVFLGETVEEESGHDAILIECNIDDMSTELIGYVYDKLFEAGANDVYISSIMMKKGRPGNLLSVICEKEAEDKIKEVIFTQTTTIGLRVFPFRKETLERSFDTMETKYGPMTIKRSMFKGKVVSAKPEFDECKQIADKHNIPLKEVYNNIIADIKNDERDSK